jgi:16S rRNA (cytosine1402-N4)-methyltransferase
VSDAEPEPAPAAPRRRRVRYSGTHPRRHEEKYKELAANADPAFLAKVRARGMTPAGTHVPILLDELLAILRLRPGMRGVDATLGWGGHAEHVLGSIAPGGQLLGLDVDPLELPRTLARLAARGHVEPALRARRTNFAALSSVLHEFGWSDGLDFLYADLGLSSMQIDTPARGFSYKVEAPLDMRMNPARGRSAAEYLSTTDPMELVRVLEENADEPQAQTLAPLLTGRRIATTRELAEVIAQALPRHSGDDERAATIRRVFQALRIEVNDEFAVLERLLQQVPGVLRSGARVAILSFHSGEDRRVKKAFAAGARDGIYAEVSDEVIRPSARERHSNPRASPAKLRFAIRA